MKSKQKPINGLHQWRTNKEKPVAPMKSEDTGLGCLPTSTKLKPGILTDKSKSEAHALLDAINAEAAEKAEKQRTIQDLVRKCLILPTDDIATPDVLLSQKGYPICSLGDFMLILGKAKCRKSLVIILIVAVFLCDQDIGGLIAHKYPNKPRVVWFDTEQSRYHSQRALRRAIMKAGLEDVDTKNIELYNLRPFAANERIDIIEEVIINQNPDNDIALVIIDGVRDITFDINSPEQAMQTVTRLMNWTDTKHLAIITVLHQNKGDMNARGHLGTELVNKCQTAASVEISKDNKDVSIVNPEQTRDVPFEPFSIYFDEDGLPCIDDYSTPVSERKKAIMPTTFEVTTHKELCRKVFEGADSFKRTDMLSAIKVAFEGIGYNFGDSKARDFLTHWQNLKLVHNPGGTGKLGTWQRVELDTSVPRLTRVN